MLLAVCCVHYYWMLYIADMLYEYSECIWYHIHVDVMHMYCECLYHNVIFLNIVFKECPDVLDWCVAVLIMISLSAMISSC